MTKIKPKIGRIVEKARPDPGFELSEKQLKILKTTSQVLLALAAVAGTVSFMSLAPNAFKILDGLDWSDDAFGPKRPRRKRIENQEKKIRKAFYYLKAKGYIKLIPQGDDFLMKVTQKGRKFKKKMKFADLEIPAPKVWDRNWWAIVADVPTDWKHRADMFREKLLEMKFYPLQRTVWLFPHDPRTEIDFLSAYLQVDRFVTTMNINKLEPTDERIVKKFFKKEGIF